MDGVTPYLFIWDTSCEEPVNQYINLAWMQNNGSWKYWTQHQMEIETYVKYKISDNQVLQSLQFSRNWRSLTKGQILTEGERGGMTHHILPCSDAVHQYNSESLSHVWIRPRLLIPVSPHLQQYKITSVHLKCPRHAVRDHRPSAYPISGRIVYLPCTGSLSFSVTSSDMTSNLFTWTYK